MDAAITRETLSDGSLRLADARASFTYRRLRPGALLVKVTGSDTGQFGTGSLDEIRLELLRNRPLELFVDAQDVSLVAVAVSKEWTQFFSLNREQLRRVSVLVGSKAMELTVGIAQHFSQTGNLIQLYSDREVFEARVDSARH